MRSASLLFLVALTLPIRGILAADPTPAVCEVHSEKMTLKKVPIQYGLPGFNKWEEKMRKVEPKLFPHAFDYALGGCVIRPEKTEEIHECSTCRKNKEDWIAKNPPPKAK